MKRSSHVALMLMGATAVGGTSYALSQPRANCTAPASTAAPGVTPGASGSYGQTPNAQPCRQSSSRWHYGSSSSYSRGSGWSRSSATPTAVAAASSAAHSGTAVAARGGFGSTGHASGGHGSSGG